jgi:hypothetical protein
MRETDLTSRVRGEYREMPGLRLTLPQASRLWQMDVRACEVLLSALVEEGFLMRTPDGAFISTTHRELRTRRLTDTAHEVATDR